MKIEKIRIQNFCSIQHATIIPESFNFFVGQNNHGKTNFFDAINFFYNGIDRGQNLRDIRFCHQSDLDVVVSIDFSNIQSGLNAMKNEKNKETLKKLLDGKNTFSLLRKNDEKWQIIIDDVPLEKNPTGFENALKDFLPRLEYVSTRQYFDDVGKFDKRSPIGIMLSGVLEAIIEKNESYRQLKEKFSELFEGEESQVRAELKGLSGSVELYLQKQFPDCSSVRFEISPPEFSEYLKNFDTHVDDGIETAVSEKGDGMQRALMLSIIQAYADYRKKDDDAGKAFIFLIDEAELHLHPTAQRKLKKALHDICSSGDQVFVSTHSSVLITDTMDDQKIFKVEKAEKITSISEISNNSEKQDIIYDLLGGAPTDLLLPPNFIIVEGASEQLFLEIIIKKFYPHKPNIKILTSDGFVSQTGQIVDTINKIYAPLSPIYGDKVVILLDGPNAQNLSAFQAFQEKYNLINSSGRMFDLGTPALEDYYPVHIVSQTSLRDKKKLAKFVANTISLEEIRTAMPKIHNALHKCWDLSYGAREDNLGTAQARAA